MPDSVAGINPGQIAAAAGISSNPCGVDLDKLDALSGLGKFNKSLFTASLLDFALKMLPGPMAEIINSDTVLPQELPGIGAMLGAASMLLEPKAAPANMTGLWGSVSKNCETGYAEASSGFSPSLASFGAALSNMPAMAVSSDVIASISAAYSSVSGGALPTSARIQAALSAGCSPFSAGGSDAAFQAYDAVQQLRLTIGSLKTPLTAANRIHAAAANSLASVVTLAGFDVSEQLRLSGLAGMKLRLDQINGIANLSPASSNMCGPDALKTLSILRQTCDAVDAFYGKGTPGFGAIDWDSMTRDLAIAIAESAISDLAAEAAGFLPFSPDKIMADIGASADSFLARGLCAGGSGNLADSAIKDFNAAANVGLTAVKTIGTIYATAGAMSATFQSTLSIMQSFGASSAINQMIGGNFGGLFGLASGQITNPKLALLRQLRSCMAEHKVDPAKLQIIDGKIKAEEAKANTAWAMVLGPFDANGFFAKTKKLSDAEKKVQNAILAGTTVPVTF